MGDAHAFQDSTTFSRLAPDNASTLAYKYMRCAWMRHDYAEAAASLRSSHERGFWWADNLEMRLGLESHDDALAVEGLTNLAIVR